ncbi:hypothetical protein PENSPDRAFT_748259 [Peniophora sp. CONT]|nr:hypothetical protein PENSPDRAFT_748259 [Peniophora sp. CONT]
MAITNWNDPTVLVEQYFDFVKLQHALFGLYMWELLGGLWFDLRLLRRRELQGSSLLAKWVYLACRYVPFVAFIIFNVGFDVTSEIDCKVWLIFTYILASSAIVLASTLIAIRSIAIWNQSRYLMGASAVVLAAETAFFIHEIVVADAVWVPAEFTCIAVETQRNRLLTAISVTDIFLLLSMFTGLLRLRKVLSHSSLWQLVWNQGLVWLLIATLAEVPTVVFLWLNLNQVMNLMFFAPELIILVIGSTRMYRALSVHYTRTVDPSVSYQWNARGADIEADDDIPMQDRVRK